LYLADFDQKKIKRYSIIMSQDFEKSLVLVDDLLVTDKVRFAVIKGASNMTMQTYNAIGGGPFTNQIIYNLQLPSLETVMSRHVIQTATLLFRISGTTLAQDAAKPGSGYLFNYGALDGFGPFPLSQLFESQTITINNTTVSQQTKSILSILLRIHDKRVLSRYNGLSPVQFDTLAKYTKIAGSNQNPFASFLNASYDNDLLPRGSYPITLTNVTGTNFDATGGATVVDVAIKVSEPLLVSPFVWSEIEGEAGIYGVQAMALTFNMSGDVGNVVRFGGVKADRFAAGALPTVVFRGAAEPSLRIQYLTPHASTELPSRNVVSFYALDRYITSNVPAFPASPAANATQSVTSASIQLAQIPDKLMITVGRPTGGRRGDEADSWLTINSINIQFNNASGILASASQESLWRFSVEAGSNQSWVEFSGRAQGPADESAAGVSIVETCGSVLMLDFAKHIQIAQEWFAPGSLGQFNLLFTVNCTNNTGIDYAAGDLQLLTVVMNSGIMSTQRGVSSIYTAVLAKADILDVSREKPMGYSDSLRMVGGGRVGDFLKRNLSSLGQAALKHGAPLLLDLAKKKLGMGEAGGAASGGKKHSRRADMGALEDRMY
jgi:hypothetical protein